MPHAHFDALARPRVRTYPNPMLTMRLVDTGGRFLVGEIAHFLRVAIVADLLARHGQFDLVDANIDGVVVDDVPHFKGASGVGCNTRDEVAAGNSHLFPIREVARPRDLPFVDGVANHAVEALLGGCSPETHRVPAVQVTFCGLRREEGVLLDAELIAELFQVAGIVPAQMRVCVAEAAHQRPSATVDDLDCRVV